MERVRKEQSHLGSRQPSFPGASQLKKTADESFRKALRMMEKAGYGIGDNVSVVVDPKLGFMGYTFPGEGGFNIVVSGAAVDSGMLEGLLRVYWFMRCPTSTA